MARLFLFLVLIFATPVFAETGESGLPLPRFVSLNADEVNVRAGPDFRFPIDWVYVRKGLPVEVIEEFGPWRRVRDHDGVEGWIHISLLSGRRSILIAADIRAIHAKPMAEARIVARAEPGTLGRLLECEPAWCRIELGALRGWLPRAHLWGVYAGEEID